MAGANDYEEERRRTVAENKRKMDELKLHLLSADLRDAAAPKPSPVRSPPRLSISAAGLIPSVRLSCFVSDSPLFRSVCHAGQVREAEEGAARGRRGRAGPAVRPRRQPPGEAQVPLQDTLTVFEKMSRGRRSNSTRKDLINRVYASDEARGYAINKAQDLQEKLGSAYPSFIKPMTQSHVTGGFWLVSRKTSILAFSSLLDGTCC